MLRSSCNHHSSRPPSLSLDEAAHSRGDKWHMTRHGLCDRFFIDNVKAIAETMSTRDEERRLDARLRMIYAMERINRLLEEPGPAQYALPDETLELVVSCVNAISDVVERRLTLDSREPGIADHPWHPLAPTG
jgi:hypothetical protein